MPVDEDEFKSKDDLAMHSKPEEDAEVPSEADDSDQESVSSTEEVIDDTHPKYVIISFKHARGARKRYKKKAVVRYVDLPRRPKKSGSRYVAGASDAYLLCPVPGCVCSYDRQYTDIYLPFCLKREIVHYMCCV